MRLIDADKFLAYLIFSKHIDGLTCGEVKEAIEMCKVDVLDKIREEIRIASMIEIDGDSYVRLKNVYEIFDWYTKESEDKG